MGEKGSKMSNLFQLKKDGKVVGYMRIKPSTATTTGCVEYAYQLNQKQWTLRFGKLWDTAHPIVCKDKNGKDVFVGDNTNYGIVVAAFESWVWTYTKDFSTYHWHHPIIQDIELIEAKVK